MIVVWGTRLYGKVDKTPSGVHVATKFFYMQFIPLLPLGSVIVLRGDRAVDAPFSFKSVLVAYLRTAGFVVGIFGGIFSLVMITGGGSDIFAGVLLFLVSAAGLAFAVGSYFIPGIGVATSARIRSIDNYLERLLGRKGMAESHGRPGAGARRRRTAAGRRLVPPVQRPSGPGEAPAAVEEAQEEEDDQLEPTADTFLVECPGCDQQLEVSLSMVGETLNCPACQNPMQIGDPSRPE
jgi:hypothetical protein